MTRAAWCACLAAAGLVLLSAAAPAGAEPSIVAAGEDLQQAIEDADEHATLVLESGRHAGPITIDRPLTLQGREDAWIVGDQRVSVVSVQADDVTIKNLHIARSGRRLSNDDAGVLVEGDHVHLENLKLSRNLHGIYIRGGEHARIIGNTIAGLAATDIQLTEQEQQQAQQHADDMHHRPVGTQELIGNGIHLWSANHASVADNRVAHARDGIYVAHTNQASFRGNQVHDCRYAVHYMYSDDNTIASNELWNNVAGAALMFSRNLEIRDNITRDHSGFRAYGMLLQNIETSTFRGNQIHGNRVGLRLQNSNQNLLQDNAILGNLAGMTLNSSSRNNTFTENRFGPNLHQLELAGPVPPTQWSVDGVGNRWHNAVAMDLTGDGISNWPHHEVDLMADQREGFAYAQLLTGSPGIQALQWALTRAPVQGVRHITDPHPLIHRREVDDD